MKRTKIFVFLAVALTGVLAFHGGVAFGASGSPGSSSDPLITKSYLEMRLKNLGGGTTVEAADSNSAKAGYRLVTVKKGGTLKLSAGSAVVLYRGSCSVTGSDGLILISTGTLFHDGDSAVKYREYLSPSSSSGLVMTGNSTVFVLGDYSTE